MSETPDTPTPETPKPTPPAQAPTTEPPKSETDWKAEARKWEERAKENTASIKQMQDANQAQMEALAKAFGLKPDEVSDTDKLAGQVTGLSEKLEQLTRANLVLSVVNAHPNLSDEDKAVIEKIPDEATMRTVAARLSEAAKPSGKPKADPPSGGGAGAKPDVDLPGVHRLRSFYESAETN